MSRQVRGLPKTQTCTTGSGQEWSKRHERAMRLSSRHAYEGPAKKTGIRRRVARAHTVVVVVFSAACT